jgi:hypothetical protein
MIGDFHVGLGRSTITRCAKQMCPMCAQTVTRTTSSCKLKKIIVISNYVKDHDGGYIGFWNDEERSETRYLMRIAEFSESSSFRTQLAIIGYPFDCAFLTCTLIKPVRIVVRPDTILCLY